MVLLVEGLKYCKNNQNVTQRHEVSKAIGKMVPIDLLDTEFYMKSSVC